MMIYEDHSEVVAGLAGESVNLLIRIALFLSKGEIGSLVSWIISNVESRGCGVGWV